MNEDWLKNVAVVLMNPSLSENIGTAARAAGNMGLGRLIVVQPYRLEREIIARAATAAGARLAENLEVYDELKDALAPFAFVAGATARTGNFRGPFMSPRALSQAVAEKAPENRIALLFGPERSGLTTAQLRLCQAVVTIPTAEKAASSLNLAQAVLLLGYELLMAAKNPPPPARLKLAPAREVNALYGHMKRTLLEIGFLPDTNSDHWLMNFKRIFNRAGLTHGECNLLRGLFSRIDRLTKGDGPA